MGMILFPAIPKPAPSSCQWCEVPSHSEQWHLGALR